MSIAVNGQLVKTSQVIVGLAAEFDRDTDSFNAHEIALGLPDLDKALALAMPMIVEYFGEDRARKFEAELLWAASFTMLDITLHQSFGFTLFALPVSGDPDLVSKSVNSDDKASALASAIRAAGLCDAKSLVSVFPFPIYPSQFAKLKPARTAEAVLAMGRTIVDRRELDWDQVKSLLGVGDRDSADDGGECILLGVETQFFTTDIKSAVSACSERNHGPDVYSRWRSAVTNILGEASEDIFMLAPEKLPSATATVAVERTIRLLDDQVVSSGGEPPNLYDEIHVTRGDDQYLITARLGGVDYGPIHVKAEQLLSGEDQFLEPLTYSTETLTVDDKVSRLRSPEAT
jgi:hypothetical protein|nr:hypothetical protein [Neorhizobium tomejilense]